MECAQIGWIHLFGPESFGPDRQDVPRPPAVCPTAPLPDVVDWLECLFGGGLGDGMLKGGGSVG